MAEPLLKRTFSRLKGKAGSRRKAEPKLSNDPVKTSSVHQTTSSPLSPSMKTWRAATLEAPDPPSPPCNHITVAKKQQWVKQGSAAPSTSSTPRPLKLDRPLGISHDALQEKFICLTRDLTVAPCVPVSSTTVQQEASQPAGGSTDVTTASISTKRSGQHAYLQSLDRSSRAWVLSSGKSQALEDVCGPQEDCGSNIWHNPIPEEEYAGNPQDAHPRERAGLWVGSTEEGASVLHQTDDITADDTDSSPASQNKVGVSGSVIDRLRSPGTVRKLSLKMRKLPELRRKLSLRSYSRAHRQGNDQNVISRYHLDSSAPPACPLRQSSRRHSASKGGHLSDGDSPERLPRQQGPKPAASQEAVCDVSSFRLYLGSDPPRCSQRVTGLLTVHLLGLEEMKTRSEGSKELFLAIQVDGVTRARTALLNLRSPALSLNHTFHLELERARQLRILVLTPGSRSQQLCVKLEPRGLLYVKLSLQEQWDTQLSTDNSPANVFGVELHHLVEKEGSAVPVPLLIQKTVAEIERRGLKVVGLYRLCGSAAVKKELRDWFERNSSAVCLSNDLYPDINVITGVLKDFLRELPSPLITTSLYQVVRDAMTLRPQPQQAQSPVELLSCLPPPERATLSLLLDHLSLVASFNSSNRMTQQNLAVCFGPVLLTPTQEAWREGGGGKGGRGGGKGFSHGEGIASAVDFKRHIEALHYLLQQWPVPTRPVPADDHTSPPPSPSLTQGQQLPVLRLALPQNPVGEVVVSRRGRGGPARLESPPTINRYAGDWSICGRDVLSAQEADYDEVAGSESDGDSGDDEGEKKDVWSSGGAGGGDLYVDDFMDFDASFNCRLSLKDFDALIHDLDRELAKQINICL